MAYQELLKKEYVDQTSKNWPALLDHQKVLASRLSELNLQLIVDEDRGYAYKAEADVEDGFKLLAKKPIRWVESVILTYLRLQQVNEAGRLDDTIVERVEIADHLRSYRRPNDTDVARFDRSVEKSIQALVDYGILIPIADTSRFLVAKVLVAAFPLAHVLALNQLYRQHTDDAFSDLDHSDDEEQETS